MPFPYKFHKLAIAEYFDAYEWYEQQQKGLGEKFTKAVDDQIQSITRFPEYNSKLRGNFRQARIAGFPFTIVYEFSLQKKLVSIAAIHHTSRKPSRRYRK